MKNFTQFASYFSDYVKAWTMGLTSFDGESDPLFIENLRQSLLECHIFEIPIDIKRLLVLTKCPNKNDHFKLPFPVLFIDVDFTQDELAKLGINIGYKRVIGIVVSEAYILKKEDKDKMIEDMYKGVYDRSILDKYSKQDFTPIAEALRFSICSITKDGSLWFDTFNKNLNILDTQTNENVQVTDYKGTEKKTKEFVHLFALNFLNLLYDTRVKTVKRTYSKQKNAKRIEKGKIPIPPRNLIRITGDLKLYTDKLKKDKKTWTYSHSWWVRGHYRVLRDREYWGSKAGTRIFIPPYIKGKGVLVEKNYELEKHTEEVEST